MLSLDEQIKALVDAGQLEGAANCALEHLGKDILGYIVNLSRAHDRAEDAFQQFCIDLWTGLPRFEWRSSFKTWAYTLARNAAFRRLKDPHDRRRERLQTQDAQAIPNRLSRSVTQSWRKTEARAWLWEAIESMPQDDRELLILRLGRKMSWAEIAAITQSDAPDADLKREAASLRKRYERLKTKLRKARPTTE